MKKLAVGILAHVDAGKTTLSESILYLSGTIRNAGRVDNGDTFLDTDEMERARGITIFSKQAGFEWKDAKITLLDTPGHVDFSAEMERTLSVIDYAVLLISAADGVQGHTRTLWRLLKKYEKPVFIFVNKMDISGVEKQAVLENIRTQLSDRCFDFSVFEYAGQKDGRKQDEVLESIAVCDEELMEQYLETGELDETRLRQAIKSRKLYPCYFGSALKMEGVSQFLDGFVRYADSPKYEDEFGAKIYKISRDENNNRLTHLKVTGGTLRVKDYLEKYDEKVNQIRSYSGNRFVSVQEAAAGEICVVTGLTKSHAGEGIGAEEKEELPLLEPVMTYRLITDENANDAEVFRTIQELEDEMPELSIEWDEKNECIQIKIMGEVQIEILKNILKERYGYEVQFGTGAIVYKETIRNEVEGVGHFEPLKHYAEVHLLLKPGESGSGIQISSICSEDELAKNWQRLILSHIEEKTHLGVLTGYPITDIQIVLAGGKSHKKHTEGGDFRQATYRAIRQGLMQAESVLLEPYFDFVLTIPLGMVGRAMTDLENMGAHFGMPHNEGDMAELSGDAPVAAMQNYAMEVHAYSKGMGRLSCSFKGYFECHNAEAVVEAIGYDAESDIENTSDSVFCAHGAGYVVPWYEVPEHMHVESKLVMETGCGQAQGRESILENQSAALRRSEKAGQSSDDRNGYEKDKELEEIFIRTFGSKHATTEKERTRLLKKTGADHSDKPYVYKPQKRKEQYLLVDGYNIIFAWEELKALAGVNMDAARDKLLDILSNYQGYRDIQLMVVFDAYKVKGFPGEKNAYQNLWVVFTREAETADQYIEKFAHNNSKKYDVTVATSDGLEQIIITGEGCRLLSARELKGEIDRVNEHIRGTYLSE